MLRYFVACPVSVLLVGMMFGCGGQESPGDANNSSVVEVTRGAIDGLAPGQSLEIDLSAGDRMILVEDARLDLGRVVLVDRTTKVPLTEAARGQLAALFDRLGHSTGPVAIDVRNVDLTVTDRQPVFFRPTNRFPACAHLTSRTICYDVGQGWSCEAVWRCVQR